MSLAGTRSPFTPMTPRRPRQQSARIHAEHLTFGWPFLNDFVDDDNKPQFMEQLDAWSIGGDIDDDNFVAAIPDSVREVEFKLKP